MSWIAVRTLTGERINELDSRPLMVLGDTHTFHVRVDVDERDIPPFQPGAKAVAYPRGETSRALGLRFVRVEPWPSPRRRLPGKTRNG